jgi:glutamate dehydrogenase
MDNVRAQLMQAIERESKQFQEYYLWLEQSMPTDFFADIKFEDIILITHSLMGFHLENHYSQINLKSGAIVLCMENPKADIRILQNFSLYGIKYYCAYISTQPPPFAESTDRLRIVIIDYFESSENLLFPISDHEKQELKALLQERNNLVSDEDFKKLIEQINTRFLATLSPERITLALDMFFRAKERDPCQYEVRYNQEWKEKGEPSMHIIFAWKNTSTANFFFHLAKVVYRHKLTMRRVNAAHINPHTENSILIMAIGLQGFEDKAAWDVCDISDFLKELVTIKYFDHEDLIEKSFVDPGLIRGNLANFLRSSVDFVHQVLVHVDPYEYTRENIEAALCHHPDLVSILTQCFEFKFHPEQHDLIEYRTLRDQFLKAVDTLDTGKEDIDERHRNVLVQAINFIEFTLKTNFYRNNKVALSFRLDPSYLDHTPFDRKTSFPVLPFAIFYMKGLCFFGFHIRFKDLARGGLRTILPKKLEYAQFDRNEVFMETYSLAYTQHKKNKDIPEGGAKGVIFLEPSGPIELEKNLYENELKKEKLSPKEIETKIKAALRIDRLVYLYQAQKAYVDSLITLVNCEEDGRLRAKHIVSYYPKPEYIYLGPDENMHIEIIEWIAAHSKKYNYRPGSSFISSKPKIGINHKEHGVTSLSVNVCMCQVLEYLGINPEKDMFTVKMTGGPDGDVAGNQMKNLYRYYPNTAKLLATIDISGTIFDPNGLDLEETYQLFKSERPINCYNPEKLSEGGFLVDIQSKKDHTAYAQKTLCWRKQDGKVIKTWLSGNEMNSLLRHTVHQTKADIFIPCGGRPATLNSNNYTDFLEKQTNKPTSRAIIEGANLYLTPKARTALEELGVLIIRDSSANKGGVIASSFEVLCGLVLSDQEMEEYHKKIVEETLNILGQKALEEAQLMLRSHKEMGLPLTEISEKISQKINLYTYQLLDYFEEIDLPKDPEHSLNRCLLSHCPKFLVKHFKERILFNMPPVHQKAIIASYLAAKVVYKMGLNWSPTLVGILPILLDDPEIFGN